MLKRHQPGCERCDCDGGGGVTCLVGVPVPPEDLLALIDYEILTGLTTCQIPEQDAPGRPTASASTVFRYYPTGVPGISTVPTWLSDCVLLPGLASAALKPGATACPNPPPNEHIPDANAFEGNVHVSGAFYEVRFLFYQCIPRAGQINYGADFSDEPLPTDKDCETVTPYRHLFFYGDPLAFDGPNCSPGWGFASGQASPFVACLQGLNGPCDTPSSFYNPVRRITVYESGATPGGPVDVCVTVHEPDCGGVAGAAIVGATVELQEEDGTPVGSDTTDSGGEVCFELSAWGTYRYRATSGGCTSDWQTFAFGPCTVGDIERDVTLCCAHVCLDVLHHVADDDIEVDAPTPLEGATVTGPGGLTGTTDEDGRACLALTTAQMLVLAPEEGSGCATRLLPLEVTHPDHPDRCLTVSVPCGQTLAEAGAAATEVVMYSTKYAGGTDRYTELPAALAGLCPGPTCEDEGWIGQDLIPLQYWWQCDYFRYDFTEDEVTDQYSVLPSALILTPVTLDLDGDRLIGDPTPTLYSPFDETQPAQRIEYQGAYTGSWTSRDGKTGFTKGRVWLCHNAGAIVSLERPSFDPFADPPPNELNVPTTLPEGSDVDNADVIYLFLPATEVDFCDFVGGEKTLTISNALGTGHHLYWLMRWTEAPPP